MKSKKKETCIGILSNFNSCGGMGVQIRIISQVLSNFAKVISFNEVKGCNITQTEIDECDYIIRHGWRHDIPQSFCDIDFITHTSKNPNKNILFWTSDPRLLHPKYIEIINKHFFQVWVDSEFNKQKAIEANIEKQLIVIPNTISVNTLTNHISDNTYRFINISNNNYLIKGVDLILKAFFIAFKIEDNVKLTLKVTHKEKDYGSLEPYMRLFEKDNRKQQVTILRKKFKHDEIFDLYANSDCLIQVSRSESFGFPALEAAFCELPVIMHNNVGMSEYEKDIFYYPVKGKTIPMPENIWWNNSSTTWFESDIESIAEKMILAKKEKRNILNQHEKLKQKFGIKRLKTALKNIIQNL